MKTNVTLMMDAMEEKGDPNSSALNQIEENLLLPRMTENRIKALSCQQDRKAFEDCQNTFGVAWPLACFFQRMFYFNCLSNERDNEDNKDDCLEQYLALRSKYRQTGDSNILRRMKAMAFPSKFKDDS